MPAKRNPAPCVTCGSEIQPKRRWLDRCPRCAIFLQRYGVDRPPLERLNWADFARSLKQQEGSGA